MKKLILMLCFLAGAVQLSSAQSGSGFGIKGGLNYNGSGELFSDVGETIQHPDKNVGFHLGGYARFGGRLYFRPELVYTNISSDYDSNTFRLQKIDVPALVGLRLIGPLNIFAGPAFQFIIQSEYDHIKAEDIEKNVSMGFNVGIGVDLGRLGIDLRYERGFSKNESKFITDSSLDIVEIDSRPSQVILSASIKL